MTYKYFLVILLLILGIQSWGQDIKINIITISGNKQTKDIVILRELIVEKEKQYNNITLSQLLDRSRNRILNLNLFNDVTISLSDTFGKSTQLNINVIEKWFFWPIPFIEFSDRNFNVWGDLNFDPARTNYGLYLFKYNLFGKNHTLKTKLKYGYNTDIGAEYKIPFLSKNTPWGLQSLINYSAQNEVWLETINDSLKFYKNGKNGLLKSTKINAEASKRLNPFNKINVGITFESQRLDSSVIRNEYFIDSSDYQNNISSYIKYTFDTRNNIFYPTTGRLLSPQFGFELWQNAKTLPNFSMEIKIQEFKQLKPKIYSALSFYSQFNTQKNIPYSQRKILGYKEIIRGFEHYVIDGNYGFKSNAAIRYHVLDKSNLKLNFIPIKNYKILPTNIFIEIYTDAGFVHLDMSNFSNKLVNRLLYSGGIGINTLMYNDRILRLEYSLNSIGEDGFFVHFKKAI